MLDIQPDDLDQDTLGLLVRGTLDAFTVAHFRAVFAETVARRALVIDLSGVSFVDSAGLGALIGGIRRSRELGAQVALACERTSLLRLFHTTGIDRIVPVTRTVDEAVATFYRTDLCLTGTEKE